MLTALFFVAALHAQENTQNPAISGIFPLALVLEAAQHAADAGAWRPDWPLELPPDAFKVLEGELTRANIEGEGYTLDLTFSPEGLVEKYPFMLNSTMTQISIVYNDALEIKELTIAYPSNTYPSEEEPWQEEPWEIEFLDYADPFTSLARGFRLNTWYFIYIVRGVNEVRETWYDVDGNFLGSYSFSFVNIGEDRRIRTVRDFANPYEERAFHFDSRGLVTELAGVNGLYRVQYFREDLPRFWERRPQAAGSPADSLIEAGHFSLHWDANGILIGISGGPEELSDGGNAPVNFRYEYSFDERGNWIERREIRMIRTRNEVTGSLGLWVPAQGTVFKRVLEYRNQQ